MAHAICPIPAAGQALQPYIHTRQETTSIREAIAHHLSSPLSTASDLHPFPPSLLLFSTELDLATPPEPSGVIGLHARYHAALTANIAARRAYAAVKLDLDEARRQHVLSLAPSNSRTPGGSGGGGGAKIDKRQSYLGGVAGGAGVGGGADLLKAASRKAVRTRVEVQRRRRQVDALGVVRQAMEKLKAAAPRALDGDLGALVKEVVGEGPEAVVKGGGGVGGEGEELRGLVFRLKRELLLARGAAEAARKVEGELRGLEKEMEGIRGGEEVGLEVQVEALRAARDELVGWMEGELSKMPGEEDTSLLENEEDGDGEGDEVLPAEEQLDAQVQMLYKQYVEARRKTILSLDAAIAGVDRDNKIPIIPVSPSEPSAQFSRGLQPGLQQGRSNVHDHEHDEGDGVDDDDDDDGLSYADLVTHLPDLVQTARAERALVQQVSHLRQQLADAGEDTRAAVRRLAGESYMVGPDATEMRAWARAAVGKKAEAEGVVGGLVVEGESCIDAVRGRLRDVERRKVEIDRLRGDL